jgi:hypothetical protein
VVRDYSEDRTRITSRSATPSSGQNSARLRSLDPVLDTLMRALPKTHEALEGDAGATVVVVPNDSERSLTWSLVADRGRG